MSKQGLTGVFVALGLVLGNVGCGDDDSGNNMPMIPSTDNNNANGGDNTNNNGGGGGDNNNNGGDTNTGGDTNNNGGGGGDTNNNGGGGDNNGGGGGFDFPDISCDATIPTTVTCGGVECPMPAGAGTPPLCTVPCCLNDECGTRSANSFMPTECRVPAKTDDRCPPYQGMVMGTPVNLPGCCMPEGVCGVVSSLSQMCITSSPLLPDLPADPAPCDSASSGNDGT